MLDSDVNWGPPELPWTFKLSKITPGENSKSATRLLRLPGKSYKNLDFHWGSSAHREADFLLHPLNPSIDASFEFTFSIQSPQKYLKLCRFRSVSSFLQLMFLFFLLIFLILFPDLLFFPLSSPKCEEDLIPRTYGGTKPKSLYK